MKLPMLDADTANHAVYGAAIALAAMLLATAAGAPHAALLGAAAAALFGAGKEAADYRSRRKALAAGAEPTHGVEWADLLGTVAGGLLVLVVRLAP